MGQPLLVVMGNLLQIHHVVVILLEWDFRNRTRDGVELMV